MFLTPAGTGLIKPAAAGVTDPNYIQGNYGVRATSAATLSVAWPTATTAGSTLIAELSAVTPGAGNLPDTPVPPAGDGWVLKETAIVNLGTGGGKRVIWTYVIENAPSQNTTPRTWSYSNGVYMGGASGVIAVLEYSKGGPVDVTAHYASPSNGGGFPWTNDTTAQTGTPSTSTTQANTLAIGAVQTNQALGTMSNGFTERISVTSPHFLKVGDKVLHATGTPNSASTYATAGANVGTLITLKFS